MKILACLFAGAWLVAAHAALAQPASATTVAGHTQTIAGDSSRTWIATSTVGQHMSAEGGCKGGETYAFHKNHKVDIRRCVDGSWKDLTGQQWSLVQASPIEVDLQIEGATYRVLFQGQGRKIQMLWHSPRDAKTRLGIDKTFRLSED